MPIQNRYFTLLTFLASSAVVAGEADVLAVKADCDTANVCSFSVQVQHADSGWEHYADAWEVTTVEGKLLASRVLAHPHVNEQPFTRSLTNVSIPVEVDEIMIRAHDSVHGHGGAQIKVRLER